jgi:hypothetical protein
VTLDPYATTTDLTAWLPSDAEVPSDADRLLARASTLVDQTVRYPYAVDAGGAATDAAVSDALRDATCAIVEGWLEAGEENDLDGLAGTQMSVPGYSGARAVTLPPRAYRALSQAGLLQPADTVVCW